MYFPNLPQWAYLVKLHCSQRTIFIYSVEFVGTSFLVNFINISLMSEKKIWLLFPKWEFPPHIYFSQKNHVFLVIHVLTHPPLSCLLMLLIDFAGLWTLYKWNHAKLRLMSDVFYSTLYLWVSFISGVVVAHLLSLI